MEDKPRKAVLIVGCGYIGQRVIKLLPADKFFVTGCVRSMESAARLQDCGVTALVADLDAELTPDAFSGFDQLYYFAPPQRGGDTDRRMTALLDVLNGGTLQRMVYISTSAVYGDCQGDWISESQETLPTTARGRRRLNAEGQLTAWCERHDVEWTILRVPGIYGPGRLPLARLEQGLPVLQETDAPYTNRIHADDLAMICVAAMQAEQSNTIFNASDGHPGNMTDYFFRVADAAGLPRPPTVRRDEASGVLSERMLSFLSDSRRMKNDKLLDELGVKLMYPDLSTGLAACFKD